MKRSPLALSLLILILALSPAAAAPGSAAAHLKALIGKVYTQETVANMERPGADGYRFELVDAKAGYARVVGPFEGHVDFFRLNGKKGEVLLEIDYACGVACTQKIAAYRFAADGSPVHVVFRSLLSLPAFEEVQRRLLTLCQDDAGDFNTERADRSSDEQGLPVCPFVVSLPKTGGRGLLYEVSNTDGSGYALSVAKSTVSPRAALKWNGAVFVGVDAMDEPAVFLNGEKMRLLF